MNRAAQLEKQIKVLIDDSVSLLKARMNELGINANSPGDLLAKAKEIVCRHKELQAKASKLQSQVSTLEQDQAQLVNQRKAELVEKYRKLDPNMDIDDEDSQELVLREISSTLAQRKKLQSQVSRLENELLSLEEIEKSKRSMIISKSQTSTIKSSRKSRDYRTRSQDWPDVPDLGKIEEQNPEILAQKILETGRKIEASKMTGTKCVEGKERRKDERVYSQQRQPQKISNMPAPMSVSSKRSKPNFPQNRIPEPPRVVNFEDRLKSIITSVLNEDEQYRSKQMTGKYPSFNAEGGKGKYPEGYPANMPAQVDEKPKDLPQGDFKMIDMYPGQMEIDTKMIHQEIPPAVEYRKEMANYDVREPIPPTKKLSMEQPDYTQVCKFYIENFSLKNRTNNYDYYQVSPAKLALRRHLSQEKLAAQQSGHYQHGDSGLVATRTIGDLMSGEIERTLEISNQSIINAAVDMSDIHGTTTITPRSVVNQNIPPRPERCNVKLSVDVKDQEPARQQLYSPISRPSSTEGNLEGLAYLNRSKTPTMMPQVGNINNHTTSVLTSQSSSHSSIIYPSKMTSARQEYPKRDDYTPLPRADIKPYHESYFTETKPPVSIKMLDMEACKNPHFIPEGLAATLHARVLNTPAIKEETNDLDGRRDCYIHERYPHEPPKPSPAPNLLTNIKSEVNDPCKSPCPFYPGQKRVSPIIQGPVPSQRKAIANNGNEIIINGILRQMSDNPCSESHSNTSTPLVDEVPERETHSRPEEGKNGFVYCMIYILIAGRRTNETGSKKKINILIYEQNWSFDRASIVLDEAYDLEGSRFDPQSETFYNFFSYSFIRLGKFFRVSI